MVTGSLKDFQIQGIVFLIIVISFTWLLYDTEEKTYTKDNKVRASHIRETLPKMVSPIEIEEYFSSTRGGRTEIKFLVKRNPNNQEINFSFCKNQEFLYTSKRYDGKVILIWEYPQKQCQRVGRILESDTLCGGLENIGYKYPTYATYIKTFQVT